MCTSCSRVLRQRRCPCSWNWSTGRSVDTFSNSADVIWHRCEPVAADPWRTGSVLQNYCVERCNHLHARCPVGLLSIKYRIEYKRADPVVQSRLNIQSDFVPKPLNHGMSSNGGSQQRLVNRLVKLVQRTFTLSSHSSNVAFISHCRTLMRVLLCVHPPLCNVERR